MDTHTMGATEAPTNPKSPTGERHVGVGSSRLSDPRAAGRQAAQGALGPGEPALAVVLASSHLDHAGVLAGICEVVPDVPLVGCTTAGEIAVSGPGESGVVVLVLSGDGFSVATGLGEIVDGDLRSAAATAARCVDAVDERSNKVLLLLSDGLAGDQQEVVRGAYQQVGAGVPLVGGCAGDDVRMEQTRQFFGQRVLGNSIVAAAIASDGPLGIGVRHGWHPVGEPMSITGSSGVVVRTLDDRPALDVYLERLDAPAEVRTDAGAFTEFAATRPLGLSRRGRQEIRFVATADFEERSIHCFAEVPQGGVGWIMTGDASSILDATNEACQEALEPLSGTDPLGMVVFDCIARKGVLGSEGVVEEVERIRAHCTDAPVAGFYTYGEIARVQGATGFHNQTLVVLAIG